LRCLKKSQENPITITYYKDEYKRGIARVNSKRGKYSSFGFSALAFVSAKTKYAICEIGFSLMKHNVLAKLRFKAV
jgi:hypothetical protein